VAGNAEQRTKKREKRTYRERGDDAGEDACNHCTAV
jgi:hypothetical protein